MVWRPQVRRQRSDVVWERTPGAASAPLPVWQRRRPEKSALWKLVAAELAALRARLTEETGRGLPAFIDRELSKYLDCGLVERGFARVQCRDCNEEILVAFTCRGRGLCPSCTTRRMVDTAAHLVDRVIPKVPVRQWVITFPRRVRWHLARDPKLASEALTQVLRVLFAWQRRCARRRGVEFGAPARSQSARSAAVVFIQRFDSALSLNFHLHALLPDGVFSRDATEEEARPRFHRLPPPTDEDVTALLHRIIESVMQLLRRRGRLDEPDEPTPDDQLPQIQLFASQPMSVARTTLPPPPSLCARIDGFSLHAAVAIHENDREGLERLARYCGRPALSVARLSLGDDGQVHYQMKRTFSDGRSTVILPAQDFLVRLCALIPPPRANLVRYFGAFGPRARGRAALVGKRAAPAGASVASPDPPAVPTERKQSPLPGEEATTADPPPAADRPRRLDWAALLLRVYAHDVLVCGSCGGRLRIIAFLTEVRVVRRILDHLRIPPVVAPRPRPPPSDYLPGIDRIVHDPCVDPLAAD